MNATVGDLNGNAERILALVQQARESQADLVAFPELALTGYPPEDLLFKRQFLLEARAQLERIAEAADGITIVVGVPDFVDGEAFPPRCSPLPRPDGRPHLQRRSRPP